MVLFFLGFKLCICNNSLWYLRRTFLGVGRAVFSKWTFGAAVVTGLTCPVNMPVPFHCLEVVERTSLLRKVTWKTAFI